MEAEAYLVRSRLFRRLKSGPHGQLVERYAARLVEAGLARQSIWRSLNVVGGLLSWTASAHLERSGLDERTVERYLQHRAGRQSIQPGDRAALARWLSVLRGAGKIAPAVLPPATPQDLICKTFGAYLQTERGLAPTTIVGHMPVIHRFLGEVCPAGADDLVD